MNPKQITCLIYNEEEIVEKQFQKDFQVIQKELQSINNDDQWMLFDYHSDLGIDKQNFSSSQKLIALQKNHISLLIKENIEHKQLRKEFDELQKKYQKTEQQAQKYKLFQKNLETSYLNLQNLIQDKEDLQKQIQLLERENEKLFNIQEKNCKINESHEATKKQIKELNQGLCEKIGTLEQEKSNLSLQIEYLEMEKQDQTKEISNQIQQIYSLQKEKSNLFDQIKSLETEKSEQSKEISNQFQQIQSLQKEKSNLLGEIKSLEMENHGQSKTISNQFQQIQSLQKEKSNLFCQIKSLEIDKSEQSNDIHIPSLQNSYLIQFSQDQTSISSHDQTYKQKLEQQLESFYYNDEFYQKNNNNKNQTKFLDQLLKKTCENKNKIDLIEKNKDHFKFSIQQISLNMDKFIESINNQNLFYQPSFIEKGVEQDLSEIGFNVLKKGQIWSMKKMKDYKITLNNEQQALDIINNQLIVKGFLQLYKEDLNKIKEFECKQQQFDLKFPKQYLIKDDNNQYYICEQTVENQENKIYEVFNQGTLVHQYISALILYFYYSTNKNCVITKYELNQNQENQDLILSNTIISSNYSQILSLLDEGQNTVDKFKDKLKQMPKGAFQHFWTEELYKMAQNQWENQK
ncbi:unnamed protein product [Paramecium sonneborni]|uniref:Uncharacterized protein n=1 Tax=Paramecium sonneborni TaxID=65129 RepID=A0A8S1N8V8_9CILI|nr:unnamed protein product [Paramecium sonneborni]